jgi:hypothetical protein
LPCTECDLDLLGVSVSCNPDGTVHWQATVRNNTACSVREAWVSGLLRRLHNSDDWRLKAFNGGIDWLAPGNNVISGDFCWEPDQGTAEIKVGIVLMGMGSCDLQYDVSPPVAPCYPVVNCDHVPDPGQTE